MKRIGSHGFQWWTSMRGQCRIWRWVTWFSVINIYAWIMSCPAWHWVMWFSVMNIYAWTMSHLVSGHMVLSDEHLCLDNVASGVGSHGSPWWTSMLCDIGSHGSQWWTSMLGQCRIWHWIKWFSVMNIYAWTMSCLVLGHVVLSDEHLCLVTLDHMVHSGDDLCSVALDHMVHSGDHLYLVTLDHMVLCLVTLGHMVLSDEHLCLYNVAPGVGSAQVA